MHKMKYYAKETPAPHLSECFGNPGDQRLISDVFIPEENRRNGAAVIFVHGGGWRDGKRQDFWWHAHRLSLQGYVTCSIDYRLRQIAPFPAALHDCQSAVQWLRREAERFGVSADRIGAMGSSAGGHLVACLGVLDVDGCTVSGRVNCVVDIHGVHDLVTLGDNDGDPKGSLEAFIGGPITEKRALWKEASPALHVDGNAAPMLLVHDPHDEAVPYSQSQLLANALIRAGRPVQFLPSPGSGHGFVYDPENVWTQQVWPVAMAWFDIHLLGMTLTNWLTVADIDTVRA